MRIPFLSTDEKINWKKAAHRLARLIDEATETKYAAQVFCGRLCPAYDKCTSEMGQKGKCKATLIKWLRTQYEVKL